MHVNFWQSIHKDNMGRIGLVLLALVVGMAISAPLVAGYGPGEYAGPPLAPPSKAHWLGTNDVGQDVMSQLFFGSSTSLMVAAGVAMLAGLISLMIGASTAFFGGVYDRFWMRTVDVLLVIPPILLVILVASHLHPHLGLIILLLSLLLWPGGARVIRAQTLSLLAKTPVAAARTYGAGWWHILFRYIAPDLGPVLGAIVIRIANRAVFMEAGLSFLGVADPETVSWGKMMQQSLGFVHLDVWQWWLVPVGIAISITVMAFSFLAYALEAALDPRLSSSKSRFG